MQQRSFNYRYEYLALLKTAVLIILQLKYANISHKNTGVHSSLLCIKFMSFRKEIIKVALQKAVRLFYTIRSTEQ